MAVQLMQLLMQNYQILEQFVIFTPPKTGSLCAISQQC